MSIRTALLTLTMLLALPACAAEGDAGSAGGDDSGDPNQETVPGDDEASPEEDVAPPDQLLACDLPFPCEDPVELIRSASLQNAYAAGDLCAFAALASGRAGLIQAVAVFPSAEAYMDHVPAGPGVILRQAHGRSDGLGVWQKPVERCTLKPAAFFEACAQGYDATCLDTEAWVSDCETLGSLTCPEP
jgi:hypothetical protein